MPLVHTFGPVYDSGCRILILGTFPSVKSREERFYYGHPRNRFWTTLAALLDCAVPQSIQQKKNFLLSHRIALWDVIQSCDIEKSSDSTIKNAKPNDINIVLDACRIKAVFANGKTAGRLYERYVYPRTGVQANTLPSTSPANAAWGAERLKDAWSAILPYICAE